MHADYADPIRRAALHRLFDVVWPGFAPRVARAAALGWNWDEITTPFARFEGDVAVAHVGVIRLPAWVDGRRVEVAGVHAVCTHPDHRGRGHFRAVMEAALAHVDAHYRLAKLSTGQPHLYARFGFSVVAESRFALARAHAGGGVARKVGASDLDWLHERLRRRVPVSNAFTALDEGWLFGIDEVLECGDLDRVYAVGDDTVVAWELHGRDLHVLDVVSDRLPDLEQLLAACPWPYDRVWLRFTPDIVAPGAAASPLDGPDVTMVRGPWRLPSAFALSPMATH